MPTYEYRCAECGDEFEKFGRMSDPPVQPCPTCGAEAQRKISGGAGLLFKGSGFYITDYRGEGYKKAAESDRVASGGESKGEGKSESKGDSKGDSKPAPKGDARPAPKSTPPSSSGGGAKSE
jgi:putative FmdB family regulatory protein